MSARFFLAAIAFAMPLDAALACSCSPATPAETVAASPVAFTGMVQSVRSAPGSQQVATVRVTERQKGNVPETIEVTTSTQSSLCGYPMKSGRSYRFAGKPDANGQLKVGLCEMFSLNPPK
jgi:hypothetical protein